MIELTKNEKLVYGYLSACQGNGESCDPKISTIAHFTGKSKQIVSKTITSLVRKDVIKRIVNPQKSSTYFVKRFEKSAVESPENVHHYINNLLKEDNNSLLNNPASGEREVRFSKKNLKEKKEGEYSSTPHIFSSTNNIDNINSSNNIVQSTIQSTYKKESVPFYENLSLTYINDARREKIKKSLTSEQKDHLKNEGLPVEEFLNLQMSLWDKLKIDVLEIKKIQENEKKYLHDFIKKYSKSKDSYVTDLIIEARYFYGRKVTISDYSRSLLEILLSKIEKMNNVVHYNFGSKSDSNDSIRVDRVW